MLISSSYDTENILGIDAISSKKYSRIQEQTRPSGDRVDISQEAKNLYSRMIHKYDHASRENATQETAVSDGGGAGASGGGGGTGGSESSNSVESIKNQIQSLKSQMAALASRMGSGADAAAMSKMNSLQAQIAALEAQLNEMA